MRTLFFLIGLIFIFSSTNSNAALFQVYDEEGKPVGKILGTVHTFDLFMSKDPDHKAVRIDIFKSVQRCSKAFCEHEKMPAGDLLSEFVKRHIKEIALQDPQFAFTRQFTKEEQEQIFKRIKTVPLPVQTINNLVTMPDVFSPWFFSLVLGMCPNPDLALYTKMASVGVDATIADGLQQEGKKKLTLEDQESYLGFMTEIMNKDADLIGWIKHSLNQEKFDLGMDLVPPYGKGYEAWEQFMSKFPKQKQDLFGNDQICALRNEHWTDVLDKEYKTGSTNNFAYVGVNHLFGKESLIERLREKGYKVEFIM